MKAIAFFNNKGGVGKTTLLCNIAAFMRSIMNLKILIVDADPQCNATSYLLSEKQLEDIYEIHKYSTIDTFVEPLRKGKGYFKETFHMLKSPRFGVDIIPGDPALALSEDLLASDWKSAQSGDGRGLQTSFIFKEIVSRYSDYDYILFDVGPSLGAINRAVLLACDYFLVPMSSDIFSLMAINNISLSLEKWKKTIQKGLVEYEAQENEPFLVNKKPTNWNLKFAGYVTQQYTAKTVLKERRAVNAYDRIIKKIPSTMQKLLISKNANPKATFSYDLGSIPNLHSLVPLSQSAHVPIFLLKASDGVVGAHFAKVKIAEEIIGNIAEALIRNIERL
jgi:cellulose biosynthesis protein BcsQ